MVFELLITFFLIITNGLLSGAEMAVVSLRKTRVATLLEQGRRGAKALVELQGQPERFLAIVQIGITFVSTAAGAFGGARFAAQLEPWLAKVPVLQPYARDLAFGVVVASISYLSLILGELVPKSLALRTAEPYALAVARPLLLLASLARPFVWFLTASSNLVLKPFSDKTTFTESRMSREELEDLVDEAAKAGAIDARTSEIASRALAFDELTALDLMVPRNRIVALPRDADIESIRRRVLEDERSRIPIYEGTVDNIIGYVMAKEVLPRALEGDHVDLAEMLRPVRTFPQTTPAQDLLQFMRGEHQYLVLVADEHGGLAGLVTFEDVVEELVGEIFEEHDRRAEPALVSEGQGTYVARGDLPLRDVERELDTTLSVEQDINTVGGLCTFLAGGVVPQRGARLAEKNGLVLEVDATVRNVLRVRLVANQQSNPAA